MTEHDGGGGMRVWNIVGTENAQEMCPALPVPDTQGRRPQGVRAVGVRCDCGQWTTVGTSEHGPAQCRCGRHVATVEQPDSASTQERRT